MELPPIHVAVQAADPEGVARLLREAPQAVHECDELQWTPLHRVAAQGDDTRPNHRTIGELLLDAGADVNARDVAGQTPLHLIALNGSAASVPVAELILERGADVGARNQQGWTWDVYWQHGVEIRNLITSYERGAV